MDQSIHVLHVEDDPEFAALVSTFLPREDDRISVRTASSPAGGSEILLEEEIDCIVSDFDMPGRNGIEFLRSVREDHPNLPFILYTGKGSEEVASDAISAGVTEYLQKGGGTSQYTVLANRIVNAVDKYRAQTELADREHRLNLFFEQSPLGVVQWDDELNFARLNDTAEGILGYAEDELVGEPWEVIVPEDDRESVRELVVSDLLTDDGGYRSINENVRKDGERIVCEWYNWVVTDENGEIAAVFSVFEDITEQKRQQRELARHREIVQSANNTIITVDETNTIRSVNPAVEKTFGYTPDELVGERLPVLMSESVADRHRSAFERYLETAEKTVDWAYFEATGQHRDGTPIPLMLSFSEHTFDGDRLFVGVISDISDRKERERALEQARDRFRRIFESSNDAIFVLDLDEDSIVDANPQAEELLGYSREELVSSVSISDIHPHDIDQYRVFLDRVEREEIGRRDDFQCVTKAGESKDCEISVSPTEFDDNRYLIATVRDISERKEHEQRLEQFASIVSHDLRNPLRVAEGHLALVQEDYDSTHLEAIGDAHERMETLIEDILSLAREGEATPEVREVDLPAIVDECWAGVETGDVTLVVDVERRILADGNRLKQLFENLFHNAVEHGGGDVTVTVGELEDGFYIEDDGPGIPLAERDDVFEAGYSTAERGTGFGLSIVEQVAEAHAWEIRLVDGSESGARFEITGVEFAGG